MCLLTLFRYMISWGRPQGYIISPNLQSDFKKIGTRNFLKSFSSSTTACRSDKCDATMNRIFDQNGQTWPLRILARKITTALELLKGGFQHILKRTTERTDAVERTDSCSKSKNKNNQWICFSQSYCGCRSRSDGDGDGVVGG